MKIKSFEVHGLFGHDNIPVINFNDDLNIISGRNGAGKTTILKLMWYLISGNFDKAVAEIKFNSAILKTDKYILEVSVTYNKKTKDNPLNSKLLIKSKNFLKGFEEDENLRNFILHNKTKDIHWFLTQYIDSSFFMPTFRMIEGGFTTEKYDIKHDVIKEFYLGINKDDDFNDIEIALNKLSNNLSKKNHKFITSISASDIDNFLVKKYAEIIKRVNNNQKEIITLQSKRFELMSNPELSDQEKNNLNDLNFRIYVFENEAEKLNTPLRKLKSAISNFLPQFRIEFDDKIKFILKKTYPLLEIDFDVPFHNLEASDEYEISEEDFNDIDFNFDHGEETTLNIDQLPSPDFITTNNLSAGEKQLLSFIAYNIFYSHTIFFIDEPELSLHVDWQSKLFSLLKEQNPTNQFIISTHSPFIYSIFPDKEIIINSDKGCSEFQKQ